MSDSEEGESNFDYEELGGYDDSEGDLDEIAKVLGDDQGRASEDPDEEVPTESDQDDEDMPSPEQNAPGTSSKKPNAEVAGISPLILPLLQAGYLSWKAERGNKRKKVWKDILRDLRVLPEHSLLTQSQWELKGQVYLRWMRRQGRKQPKESELFPAAPWTFRKVVKHEQAKRINALLETEYGVTLGTGPMLKRYQEAVNEVIDELSAGETEEMQQKAEQWNEQTEPDSVKARFATRQMTPLVRKFTEAMWKRGGVRMVVLAGYKDEQNAYMTACFDYNQQFNDGPKFREASVIEGPWDRYIERCFRGDSDDLSENDNGSGAADGAKPRKQNNNLSGEAAMKLVVRDDGGIWMPDLLGRNRSDLQALVRAYLTAHYRKACKNPRAVAPFKKLSQHQDRLFAAEHLPDGFTFPSDPSHMLISDALRFLQFIRERQEKCPEDVFAFLRKLDREGDLVEIVEDTDDSDTEALIQRGKKRYKHKKTSKLSATASSRQVNVSKTYGRLPRGGSQIDAEETDAEPIVVSTKQRAAATPGMPNADVGMPRGSRNARPAAGMPGGDVPNVDDELPRHIETGRSAEMARKTAKGKGKEIHRPTPTAEVGRSTALSIQQVPPAGTLEMSLKIGPPKGVKRSKDLSTQQPPPAESSETSVKIGPPTGVKRSKVVAKTKALPNQRSAPNGTLGTSSSKDASARQLPHREQSGPLKSALKTSTSKQTNESEDNIPTLGTGVPRSKKPTQPSQRGEGSRSTADTTLRPVTPPRSVRTNEAVDDHLEPTTPRRSNRERRAPARVDEEEPSLKRPAPTGPLTTQFKAKRTRFN